MAAESGAALGDSVSGGGFAGFSYRFGDRLTIGPGVGAMTQIEDSPDIFPVLLIDWKITDRLRLETGRGLGATRGPGLILRWDVSDRWDLSVGGRYEKLRFRLDREGVAPDGVGSDRSFPLFCGATYRFTPRAEASLVGGVALGGELLLEDENGNRIAEEDYGQAGFLGVAFGLRF
jgi:outer membrane receptor protein involved in Fe transport